MNENTFAQEELRKKTNLQYAMLDGEEDISRREEFSKHYDLGAGRRQAILFSEPVHYRDEAGSLREIDNTLCSKTLNGRQIYQNVANPLHVEFPVQADNGDLVRLTHSGHTLSWRFDKPVSTVAAQIQNGAELVRAALLKKAARLKTELIAASDTLANAKVLSARSIVEKLSIPGLNTEALAEVFQSNNLNTIATDALDFAVRTPLERRSSRIAHDAALNYHDLLPGISAEYQLEGTHLKENIVVSDRTALTSLALRLCGGFDFSVCENQAVDVRDPETGELAFTFAPPLVYDAEGKREIASVILEPAYGFTRLSYHLSDEYLSKALFPITIDPVVKTGYKDKNAIADAYIWKKNPNTNYGDVYLMRCGMGEGGESISLIRFNKLISQSASDTIISAMLRLCPENYGGDTEYFGCYPIKTSWKKNEVTWNKMAPDNDVNISKDLIAYITNTKYLENYFDITNLCRSWYKTDGDGQSTNHGVAIRYPAEVSTSDKYVEWTSTSGVTGRNPRLVVNYVSHAGLESWWKYETMSAGRAGTAHVDIYNGNLVFEHPDVAMSGALMPVSVTHYYNSCLSKQNDLFCGLGWRTSLHQSVHKETLSSTNYYVWTDGDGTEHYFEIKGTAPYEDCEGMKLKLGVSGGNLTIIDKAHNSMIFPTPTSATHKYISKTTDASGNTMTFEYDTSVNGKIMKVKDGVNRETTFHYDDATMLLSKIQSPDGRWVSFAYDAEKHLTGTHYSDLGANTAGSDFTYESNGDLLIQSKNYDGISVSLEYEDPAIYDSACIENFAEQARKVISLEYKNLNPVNENGSPLGAKTLICYEDMATKVTSVHDSTSIAGKLVDTGKTITYQFNDSGNVVCMFDELGYAQAARFESGIPNTESQTSRLQKAVINLATNVDFSSDWVATQTTASNVISRDTTVRCLNMPSLKMQKVGNGLEIYAQDTPVSAGGRYTFSAYVKTDGLTNGHAFLQITQGNQQRMSRKISASTASQTGGPAAEGWERIYVTMETDAAGALRLELLCDAQAGCVWFSCPQLETGSIPNRVNLLTNGDFSRTTMNGTRVFPEDWAAGSGITSSELNCVITSGHDMPVSLSGNAVRMTSAPARSEVSFVQSIPVSGIKGDSFVIGGWVNAKSVARNPNQERKNLPALVYRFVNGSTNGSWQYAEFSPEWIGWQFGCWPVVATGTYTSIEFSINYARNAQTAMFSNVFLHREQFGESYAYDEDKNVTSIASLSETKASMKYDKFDNLTEYVQPGAAAEDKYLMTYGDTDDAKKKHRLLTSKTPLGVTKNFSYDSGNGNQTMSKTVGKVNGADTVIGTKTAYDTTEPETPLPDGVRDNYAYKTFDSRGNAVTRNMNPLDFTLSSVADPAGQTVNYSYDAAKRVTKVESLADGACYKNEYSYEKDRLKTISHNTNSNTCDVIYRFDYDNLGRKKKVVVVNGSTKGEDVTLSESFYSEGRSGLLKEVKYGNNGKVSYEHDEFDRLKSVTYDGKPEHRYTYEYGANGQAMRMEDHHLERVHQTEYDLAERPMQSTIRDLNTDELIYRSTLHYDAKNRLDKFAEQTPNGAHETSYTYDKDNRTTSVQFDDANHKVDYTYDGLGRIATRKATNGSSNLETSYGYVAGSTGLYGTGATTPLVASIQHRKSANEVLMNFSYTYDNRGNIISETRDGVTTTYAYDALGQLIRVNDPSDKTAGTSGTTWVYAYDFGGNIQSKTPHAYTTGPVAAKTDKTIAYKYDSHWKDKLIQYDGKTIEYDAIGNPTNDGMRQYKWAAGRQLESITMDATLEEAMNTIDGTDELNDARLKISFSNYNIISDTSTTTIASASIYQSGTDITVNIPAALFAWKRNSNNAAADAAWNAAHKGVKQITLSSADMGNVVDKVTITCTLQPEKSYGGMSVNDTLMASHTPSPETAGDVFSVSTSGDLTLNTSRTTNPYILEDNCVKATSGTNFNITASAEVYAALPKKTLEFKYNADGLRTQKKLVLPNGNVVTTDYILHGKLLMELRQGENELHFFYDATSKPVQIEFNHEEYTYLHNLQGDVVRIVDKNNTTMVQYRYDAWGKLLNVDGTLALTLGRLNPFRYRCYTFDDETQLFYLRTRYYDFDQCRFLNLDSIIPDRYAVSNLVLYSYCGNNPIVKYDSSGAEDEYVVTLRMWCPAQPDADDLGHYDLMIEGEINVCGVRLTNPVFSYGRTNKNEGRLTVFSEKNSMKYYHYDEKRPYELYELPFTISDSDYDTFKANMGKWAESKVLNKKNQNVYRTYKVIDSDFSTYDLEKGKVCLTAALRWCTWMNTSNQSILALSRICEGNYTNYVAPKIRESHTDWFQMPRIIDARIKR